MKKKKPTLSETKKNLLSAMGPMTNCFVCAGMTQSEAAKRVQQVVAAVLWDLVKHDMIEEKGAAK